MTMTCRGLIFLVFILAADVHGIRLPACRDDGTLELSTTTNMAVVTCDDFNTSDVIVWTLETPSENITLGNCDASGACTNDANYNVSFSRGSVNAISNMTVHNVTAIEFAGSKVTCSVQGTAEKVARCTMDVVHPAEVASCNAQATPASWTADIQCDVTRVKSSLNRYQCHWYRGTSEDSQTTFLKITTFTPRPRPNDTDLAQGACSLTSDLVAKGGSYYYRVVVYPGGTEQVTRPVILVEPLHPTISCSPKPWTADSKQLTCTCSTKFTGQPVGRLQFFRGDVGVINSGRYGDLTLAMPPQNVSVSELDTDRAYFSCLVHWVGNSPRDPHHVTQEEASSVPLTLALTVGILGGLLFLALVVMIVLFCRKK
ncbi:uncharacterized protein [Littorina saxatilis]|uniref:uncharacterized protein isoform X2 n=1 Tax=Littorina saxatilis TaxID=31220 RepID=UPI0038B44CF1